MATFKKCFCGGGCLTSLKIKYTSATLSSSDVEEVVLEIDPAKQYQEWKFGNADIVNRFALNPTTLQCETSFAQPTRSFRIEIELPKPQDPEDPPLPAWIESLTLAPEDNLWIAAGDRAKSEYQRQRTFEQNSVRHKWIFEWQDERHVSSRMPFQFQNGSTKYNQQVNITGQCPTDSEIASIIESTLSAWVPNGQSLAGLTVVVERIDNVQPQYLTARTTVFSAYGVSETSNLILYGRMLSLHQYPDGTYSLRFEEYFSIQQTRAGTLAPDPCPQKSCVGNDCVDGENVTQTWQGTIYSAAWSTVSEVLRSFCCEGDNPTSETVQRINSTSALSLNFQKEPGDPPYCIYNFLNPNGTPTFCGTPGLPGWPGDQCRTVTSIVYSPGLTVYEHDLRIELFLTKRPCECTVVMPHLAGIETEQPSYSLRNLNNTLPISEIAVDSATGELSLANWPTGRLIYIRGIAQFTDNKKAERSFLFYRSQFGPITNQPIVATNTAFELPAGSTTGAIVGRVVASDPNWDTTLTYSTTSEEFTVDSAGMILSAIDWSGGASGSYVFDVDITSSDGSTATVTVTVTIVQQPLRLTFVDSNSSPNQTVENSNTTGIQLAATDPDDSNATFTYSLETPNPQLTVFSDFLVWNFPDYESGARSILASVRATASNGKTVVRVFRIEMTAADEFNAGNILIGQTFNLPSFPLAGTLVGNVLALSRLFTFPVLPAIDHDESISLLLYADSFLGGVATDYFTLGNDGDLRTKELAANIDSCNPPSGDTVIRIKINDGFNEQDHYYAINFVQVTEPFALDLLEDGSIDIPSPGEEEIVP